MECMQYTVRGIPGFLDSGLRDYAAKESKSLNQALIEMLSAGLGYFKKTHRNEDLLALSGSWVEDPECEKALAEMDHVDEEIWK